MFQAYKYRIYPNIEQETDAYHICLNQVSSLPLDIRSWTCEHCQTTHDRDLNAAVNINPSTKLRRSLADFVVGNQRYC